MYGMYMCRCTDVSFCPSTSICPCVCVCTCVHIQILQIGGSLRMLAWFLGSWCSLTCLLFVTFTKKWIKLPRSILSTSQLLIFKLQTSKSQTSKDEYTIKSLILESCMVTLRKEHCSHGSLTYIGERRSLSRILSLLLGTRNALTAPSPTFGKRSCTHNSFTCTWVALIASCA